jgi:hypothetical protein
LFGRVGGGLALALAPLFLLAGSLLLIGLYVPDTAQMFAAQQGARSRALIGYDLAVAGVILAAPAVVTVACLAAPRAPRLAAWGGSLALVGLFGPAFFLGVNHVGLELSRASDRAQAVAIHDAAYATFTTANLLIPAILAGWIVLAVAAARSGVLGRIQAVALGLTAAAPAGLATGFMPVAAFAWAGMAVALVPLGIRLLRPAAPVASPIHATAPPGRRQV